MGTGTPYGLSRTPEDFLSNVSEMEQDGGNLSPSTFSSLQQVKKKKEKEHFVCDLGIISFSAAETLIWCSVVVHVCIMFVIRNLHHFGAWYIRQSFMTGMYCLLKTHIIECYVCVYLILLQRRMLKSNENWTSVHFCVFVFVLEIK